MRVRSAIKAGLRDDLNVQPDKADSSSEDITQARVDLT